MSIKNTRKQVAKLVTEELRMANRSHAPFNSPMEGYAVIMEEVEELGENYDLVEKLLDKVWRAIRTNEIPALEIVEMENAALDAACEAIQVAAMCQKWQQMGIVADDENE